MDPEVSNDPTSPKRNKCMVFVRQNLLTLLTFLSVVLGISFGFGLRKGTTWTKRDVMYVNFPGELFLCILRCLTLPLIMSSLMSAVGSLDTRLSGKIGVRAILYYLATTVLAIIMGIVLVVSIKPGAGNHQDMVSNEKVTQESMTEDTLMDLVRNMFPPNIIQATMEQYKTVIIPPESERVNTSGDNISETPKNEWEISGEFIASTNILGLVMFSIVLGVTLAKMDSKGKPLLDMITSLSEAMMLITSRVVWLTPIGVLFLIAAKLIEMDDLSVVFGQLGLFTATIMTGFFIHGVLILPAIYSIITKTWPFTFIYNMSQALMTAFGTASSSATLPVTFSCLEQKNKIDPRISRFCLPIGATINMDGTALYEAVAAIFIAQLRNVHLNVGKIVAISVTSTAASIGAAGIPQAALVTMVLVLNVVGLPPEDAALVFVVDWFIDRFRTAVNVLGDAFGAAIVAHLSSQDLQELSKDTKQTLNENTNTDINI